MSLRIKTLPRSDEETGVQWSGIVVHVGPGTVGLTSGTVHRDDTEIKRTSIPEEEGSLVSRSTHDEHTERATSVVLGDGGPGVLATETTVSTNLRRSSTAMTTPVWS